MKRHIGTEQYIPPSTIPRCSKCGGASGSLGNRVWLCACDVKSGRVAIDMETGLAVRVSLWRRFTDWLTGRA